jgi:hypothetical protein
LLSPSELAAQLSLVRHVYERGVDELSGPFPAIAVLSFHDALELLLSLAVEHHSVAVAERAEFLELFDRTAAAVLGLQARDALVRINATRKAVKHKAIEISKDEADRCRNRAQVFLEANSPLLFGCEFFRVSGADRVTDDTVRSLIKDAETALDRGELTECMVGCAKAVDVLSRKHHLLLGRHYHGMRPEIALILSGEIGALEDMVKMLAVGIDYRRYVRFSLIAPIVSTTVSGVQNVHLTHPAYTREQCVTAIEFATDLAVAIERYNRQL